MGTREGVQTNPGGPTGLKNTTSPMVHHQYETEKSQINSFSAIHADEIVSQTECYCEMPDSSQEADQNGVRRKSQVLEFLEDGAQVGHKSGGTNMIPISIVIRDISEEANHLCVGCLLNK